MNEIIIDSLELVNLALHELEDTDSVCIYLLCVQESLSRLFLATTPCGRVLQ